MKNITERIEQAFRNRGASLRGRIAVFVLACLAAFAPTQAFADAIPGNDSGTLVIRILPSVDLGVVVDTTGSHWFGSSDLNIVSEMNTTQRLETGVKLTIVGNFNNQELQIEAVANDTWSLDADETPGEDQLRLYALIGADQAGSPPAAALYTGTANLVGGAPVRAGQPQADELSDINHTYEFSTAQTPEYQDVDGMEVGTTRSLWLRADTPPVTTSDEQQTFTITVTAVTGAGF